MTTLEKVELIAKLLEEVKDELKENSERYLSIDNKKLRIKNNRLFEENTQLKRLQNERLPD